MLHLDLEPRKGYLCAHISGVISLADAQATFTEVLKGAIRYQQPRVLLDCMQMIGDWTPEDRMVFGAYLADQQMRVAKSFSESPQIAILVSPSLMDPGRLTQTVANNRGARMRASDSLQELLSWLGV